MKKGILSVFLALTILTLTFQPAAAASEYYEYAGSFGESSDGSGYTLGNPVAISKDSSGYYYVADIANNRIVKLNSSMQKVATLDNINMPLFVYADNSDNILICELGTNKILKYSSAFAYITEWGGKGAGDGQFNIPRSIVQDSSGNYYVSDELNHRIQKFSSAGVFIAAYGSYGSGNGQFKVQQGLSIDAQDRLYVADTYNNRIQVFQTTPSWSYLTQFGSYGVYNAYNYYSFQPGIMNHPRGVYVNKTTGKVAVTDSSNNRVMVYNGYSSNFSFYESQNGYLGMSLPTHAILDDSGKLIVLDSHSRILKYNSALNNTNLFTEYGSYRSASGVVSNAQSVAVSPGGSVYVSDSFNHRIQVFDASGTYVTSFGGIGGPYGWGTNLNYFHYPKQIAFDSQSTLYVADYANARVVAQLAAGGSFFNVAVSPVVTLPWGVAVDSGGYVYISDWYDDMIKVVYGGALVDSWGGTGSQNGKFNKPCDLKIGVYNGQTALYVADCGNNRVQIFTLGGTYLGKLGEPTSDPLQYYDAQHDAGAMLLPYGIAIDADDNVLISDTSHKCMRMYNSSGTLLESWGTMSNTDGNFFSPMGCDINKTTGRLYITDGVLERVQYFDPAQ